MESVLALRLDYSGQGIRVVGTRERPEWVAADVCKILTIGNPRQALSRFDDDEKGVTTSDTPGGPQQVATVTEPGLYRLIFLSRKPEARAFRRWVFHEVLPCVREHGCFPAPKPPRGRQPGGVPSYRLHKPTGRAVVTIDGRDHYLGKHGTPESLRHYRVLMEMHRGLPVVPVKPAPVVVLPPPPPPKPARPLMCIGDSVNPSAALIRLSDVPAIKWLPCRVSKRAAWTWHRRGVRGVKLETVRAGARLWTTEMAVLTFMLRAAEGRTAAQQTAVAQSIQNMAHRRAKERLVAMGVLKPEALDQGSGPKPAQPAQRPAGAVRVAEPMAESDSADQRRKSTAGPPARATENGHLEADAGH